MNTLWQEWAYRLGWTMLHSLWEGAGVVLLLAVALGATRRRSPNERYAIATIAMATLVGVIGFTFAHIVPVSVAKEVAIAPHAMPSMDRIIAPVQRAMELPAPGAEIKSNPAGQSHPVADHGQQWRAWLQLAVPWLAGLWAVGVCVLTLLNAGSWLAVQRLRVIGVSAIDARWEAAAERLALRLGVRRRVRVAQSSRVETPIVVGWWWPLILVPASVLVGLAPAQLEAILAHELAHVQRNDYLVNLLQVVVETLLFYHPAVWWMSNRMRLEREHCCDDVAVALCGDRQSYAESLAALEEVRLGGNLQLAARGSGGAQLIERVRRILGISPTGSGNPAWRGAAVVAMIAVAVMIAVCAHVRSVKGPAVIAVDRQELGQRLEQADTKETTKRGDATTLAELERSRDEAEKLTEQAVMQARRARDDLKRLELLRPEGENADELKKARLEASQSYVQAENAIRRLFAKTREIKLLIAKHHKRLLIVTEDNYFLQRVAQAMADEYHTSVIKPEQFTTPLAQDVDVVWFDRFSPKDAPNIPAIYFDAVPPSFPLVHLDAGQPATLNEATATEWDRTHASLNGVSLAKVYVKHPLKLAESPDWAVLARSGQNPLIVASKANGVRTIVVGFDLLQSDWPLRTSFPVFAQHAGEWLLASDGPPAATRPGAAR